MDERGPPPNSPAPGAPTAGPATAGARSLVEAAYATLRRDILTGDLAPGSKLRFEMLRARYGWGASTLREALTRLVGEALVTAEEQRGFRVAPVSLADFADLTHTRVLVELEALRQSITRGDDAWEAGVVAAFHRLSKLADKVTDDPLAHSDAFEDRNRDFHRALIAACPSRWLHHLHGILFQQAERYRRLSLVHGRARRDVHAEHRAVMEAALARDVETACALERAHIEATLGALGAVLPPA